VAVAVRAGVGLAPARRRVLAVLRRFVGRRGFGHRRCRRRNGRLGGRILRLPLALAVSPDVRRSRRDAARDRADAKARPWTWALRRCGRSGQVRRWAADSGAGAGEAGIPVSPAEEAGIPVSPAEKDQPEPAPVERRAHCGAQSPRRRVVTTATAGETGATAELDAAAGERARRHAAALRPRVHGCGCIRSAAVVACFASATTTASINTPRTDTSRFKRITCAVKEGREATKEAGRAGPPPLRWVPRGALSDRESRAPPDQRHRRKDGSDEDRH
jgi:hypothetical protein